MVGVGGLVDGRGQGGPIRRGEGTTSLRGRRPDADVASINPTGLKTTDEFWARAQRIQSRGEIRGSRLDTRDRGYRLGEGEELSTVEGKSQEKSGALPRLGPMAGPEI